MFTLSQRHHIEELNIDQLSSESYCKNGLFNKVLEVFAKKMPAQIKAGIDATSVEAFLLTLKEINYDPHLIDDEFPEILTRMILEDFLEKVPINQITTRVQSFEAPTPKFIVYPFVLSPTYFSGENPPLPKELSIRQGNESLSAYKNRVKSHLLRMSPEKFMQLAALLNPEEPSQKKFAAMFVSVTNQRANLSADSKKS